MKHVSLVGLAALLCVLPSAWAGEATPAPPPARSEVLSAGGAARGAAKPETSEPIALDDLAKGDRIVLVMKNGQQFEGHVVGLAAPTIRIDFTFSRQKMTGVITFPRADASSARRLPALTNEEKAAILELRRQTVLEARQQWSGTVATESVAPAKPDEAAAVEKAAEEKQTAEYRALLAEFPPDQGWGPQRLADIRHRHFIVGLPVTYQDQRFWQLFDQWSEAQTMVELYDQRQKQEREMLLTLFPPEEGWNAAARQRFEDKQKSGEQLTKLEAQFLKDYDAWQKAVAAKQAEKPTTAEAALPVAPGATPPTPPSPPPVTEAPGPQAPPVEAPAPESPGTAEPAKP